MNDSCSRSWRRDLVIGVAASLLTLLLLAPFAWASHHRQQEQADAARREAQVAREQAEAKGLAVENEQLLILKGMFEDAAALIGLADKSRGEAMHVTTAAVTPEVPKDALMIIDKKATTYTAGDIVIFL